MAIKPWQAPIPQKPKKRDQKRCYTVWNTHRGWIRGRFGGKVVWLTDKQLTFARIKYPHKEFDPVLEKDRLENYKKYLDQTIE